MKLAPLVFAAVLLAPLASASAAPAPEALLDLARADADPALVLLAQLARQDGDVGEMLAAAGLGRPPAFVYREVLPACDLDADGVPDAIVNNLTLRAAPTHAPSRSEIEAISGATGERLWKVDNLLYASMPTPPSVAYATRGQPLPGQSESARPHLDLDGDGACDVIAAGLDTLPGGLSTPFLGEPSVSRYRFTLRALSGATGEDLWSLEELPTTTSASEPIFGTTRNVLTAGFPTGLLLFEGPEGPRVALKLTDLRYHTLDPPFRNFRLPPPVGGIVPVPPRAEDVRVTERIRLLDATDGALLWERAVGTTAAADVDTRFTNMTWLAGAGDLDGDGTPEILLDQLLFSTPRGDDWRHPITGDALFRYGRGARVTALSGADGATLWSAPLLEPLAARPNVAAEESYETLAWIRSAAVGDATGDGVPDVLATWVALEESLPGTTNGLIRTHVVLVSGADGAILWDVRQQGWGFAKPLDDAPTTRFGLGMLDVPMPLPEGAPMPAKFVRLLALDASTGDAVWSHERAYAQNSVLSYNLGLSQYNEALAPYDWDGDGLRDLVTPAQESPRRGRDQVLLATTNHTYDVRSGADGRVLGTILAWGPQGRVLACPGAEDRLTVVTGHARRLEAARYELSGERLWRSTLHHDPAPRAATTGIDAVALAAACADAADGTLLAVDLQAYSFERGHEVVPVLARFTPEGTAAWMTPELQGTPPGEALFRASVDHPPPTTAAKLGAAAIAALVGIAAALATLALLRRAGSRLLAVGLVLVMLAPAVTALALPAPVPQAPPAAPADLPTDLGATRATPAAVVDEILAFARGDETPPGFLEKDTITFTHDLGDVDGDGHADLGLDQYCFTGEGCDWGFRFPEDFVTFFTNFTCGARHYLTVVSGRDAAPIWSKELTVGAPYPSCARKFVMGALPTEEGPVLIVYKMQRSGAFDASGVIFHEIQALRAADGEPLWTYEGRGTYAGDIVTTYDTRDLVIVPVLMSGPEPSLFLEGIGWTAHGANTIFPLAPFYDLTNRPVEAVDSIQPHDWAARLDPATGEVLWRRDTFQPVAGRSVYPMLTGDRFGDGLFYAGWWEVHGIYWNDVPCCGDVTGDGVPDLVYRTLEWNPLPNVRVAEPTGLDARLVILDGATGETRVDRFIAQGIETDRNTNSFWWDRYHTFLTPGYWRYAVRAQPVGDADGDGAGDFLLHQIRDHAEFRHNVTLVSGATGEDLWSLDTVRDKRLVVLGDADRDGGNDLLLLTWHGHEAGGLLYDEYVTPAGTYLTLLSGRTGQTIWRTTSWSAPADVDEYLHNVRRNGAPDVDGDGMGDVFVDDPVYLDDLTVVHRVTALSGRDASPIFEMTGVGAFALPGNAGDLDDDGRDEVALLSGDLNDLWLTVTNGATGEPEWSRRILALPTSTASRALPFLRYHEIEREGVDALSVNLHMELLQAQTWISIRISDQGGFAAQEVTEVFEITTPQMVTADGRNGGLAWSIPPLEGVDEGARVAGATPGSQVFADLAARTTSVGLLAAGGREAKPFALPVGAAFVVAYAVTLAAGVAVVRLRGRFEGVPELD